MSTDTLTTLFIILALAVFAFGFVYVDYKIDHLSTTQHLIQVYDKC